MTTPETQPEIFIPNPAAGAALLQIALENLLLGESGVKDTVSAIETAFRGAQRYNLTQEGASGQFCRGSVIFKDSIGAQGNLGIQPVVLVEETMGAPTEIRPQLSHAGLSLFAIEPIKIPTTAGVAR